MLPRIVAVLTGLALLACSWWMVDRNDAHPAGEVSLDLVAVAPNAKTVIYEGGDADGKNVTSPRIENAVTAVVTWDRGTSCADLPAIGGSLEPAPRWVVVDGPDSTSACALSGRWRLADLVDEVGEFGDGLSVSASDGRLRFEYEPSTGDLASYRIIDFDLRVKFPADVESVDGTASLSGNTVHWAGTEGLRPGSRLSATSRIVSLPQEVAPWAVGTLALLIFAVGILWPSPQLLPVAADPGGDAPEPPGEVAPVPSRVAAVTRRPIGPIGPDPNSPWLPPS